MPFCKPFFDTEGPFGLPMKDDQAKSLEARLKDLPRDDTFALRRLSLERGLSEVSPPGRCDVSWISEESPDRLGDVVLAAGMDDSHFRKNPIVTFNHQYQQPPVGRSLWRRKVREGPLVGIKAKTHYPPRPESWQGDWQPDHAFQLIEAGLLRGKSIGFIPLKLHAPTAAEVAADPALKNVRYVIESWLLAEYACCYLPVQPNAVVAEILKSMSHNPLAPTPRGEPASNRAADVPFSFTSQHELENYLPHFLHSEAFTKILEKSLLLSWKNSLRSW